MPSPPKSLVSRTCAPCRGGIPPLTRDQVKVYSRHTPEWAIRDKGRRIERTFKFKNFAEAFFFTKRAGDLAATSLGRQIVVFNASTESELDAAFASVVQQRIGTLLGASDPFLFNRRTQIVSLEARHGIPAIYYLRDFAHAGGLMSYGNSLTDMYRLVGVYVGRILKGEKPTDLPVVQSTKFEFVINLQTARALGIEVPNSMQLLADEVIE
jgi:ABC transporter substrate binding protein/Pterin 4 alpha carbinolamine dehydratase